jgi:hypothetical protein
MPTKIEVKCSAELRTKNSARITRDEAVEFLSGLPIEADISPIVRNLGSQRDPMDVLVGFSAKWTEHREQ